MGKFWYYNKRVYFGRISKQPKTEERLAVTSANLSVQYARISIQDGYLHR
jgi:hypothetical protein